MFMSVVLLYDGPDGANNFPFRPGTWSGNGDGKHGTPRRRSRLGE